MMLGVGDRQEILRIIKKGTDARAIYRANALNLRDKGLTAAEVADFLEITARTVFNIESNYEQGGLGKALYDDPRPGAPVRFDDAVRSRIVALVCSDPPEGFDRWTLRLVREKAVKKGMVEAISIETIRVILEEHDLKPWRQQSWCVPELDEEFIERMEDVLAVYERPYDPRKPVVCLDEKPVQLTAEVRPPTGLAPGRARRTDYEYERKGTANVFCAIEPLKGKYLNRVTENRKAREFAKFLSSIERRHEGAEKIVLVLDNLNIHCKKSLTDFYGETQGHRFWNRFEVHYTPRHGSWLNQAEIAINIYSRQCLGKSRIPDIERLRKTTQAWNRVANQNKVAINWKFSRKDAREKFQYEKTSRRLH
jgi:transposase